jgi:AcrR family transcriptional regulator
VTDRKTRPTGQHHGDLRNALEAAALELIAENGPRGFTLAEACRRAGVSVAAPYKHFADRDALLAALAERGYDEQRRRYGAALGSTVDPVEQMARFAAAYVRFAVEERGLFEATFSAGLDKSRYPALAEAGQRLLLVLHDAAARLRPDPKQALGLVHAVAAGAHGFAAFVIEGIYTSAREAEEQASNMARLIAADRPRSGEA